MNLKDFTRGWLVGDFEPSILRTGLLDLAVATYTKGDNNPVHYHKRCTEYNIIISGKHVIGDKEYSEGDICVVEPNEATGHECLETGTVIVIKIPSGKGDKYLGVPE